MISTAASTGQLPGIRGYLAPSACGECAGVRSMGDTALLVITDTDQSDHAGAVDEDLYQLCANLHLAECN